MKKLLVFAVCVFACYVMQGQCGGCPHHKQQTGCTKTVQTVKSDSVKVTKATPVNGRASISTQSATTVKQEESKVIEGNVKAVPASKATIREDKNAKNSSAR